MLDAGRTGVPPFLAHGIAVDSDFFAMFDVPFVRGGAWADAADERAAHVAVVRESVAERLFPGDDPIGRSVRLGTRDHVVTGVVADRWQPLPRFYRVRSGQGPFGESDDLIIPFATAITDETPLNGNLSCFSGADANRTPGFAGLTASQCVWIELWVELESSADAPAYRDFLAGYVADQRALGRFPRPDNHRLHDVRSWLDVNHVVANDSRLQVAVAFGFLLVCLVNTIALLLAKFTARSGEIGVRRALGASRRTVFLQHLIETAIVGLAGGIVGVVATFGCLWLIGRQSEQLAAVARMDWVMLVTTFTLAIGASLAAGLLPTWRACQIQPALQLKSR